MACNRLSIDRVIDRVNERSNIGWDAVPVLAKTPDVQPDRLADVVQCFLDGLALAETA
jgi:hypothetical protein